MTTTLDIIRTTLSEVANADFSSITPATDIANDLDLDSILFVHFLLALEEKVPGLEFNQETLSEVSFTTIGTLVTHVDNVTASMAA
nr:acyl carrier protein [uncultured Gellertiella sp.]